MFKKLFSCFLAAALLLTFFPVRSVCAADIMHIASVENWEAFVAAGDDVNAVLDADIDLGSLNDAIPAFEDGFHGTLDGNGHMITYTYTAAKANFCALIRTLAADGTIKNLTVDGSVTVSGSRTGRNYHGGIVFQNAGTIENCVSSISFCCSDTISSTKNVKYVGGIAAKNSGVIRSCVFDGKIENITTYAGGIVAENNGGSLYDCTNNGAVGVVNVSGYAGGIAAAITASSAQDKMVLENCNNKGSVTGGSSEYGYAGGIVGQINIASSYVTYDAKPEITLVGCSNMGILTAGNTEDMVAKNNNPDNCTLVIEAGTPAHEHTYDTGVVTKEPTCTQTGIKTFTCTTCDDSVQGHSYTETIEMLPHTMGEWETDAQDKLVRKCTLCGTVLDVDAEGAVAFLQNAVQALNDAWFRLVPVYGTDTNVNTLLSAELEKLGFHGIGVCVKSAENPEDGTAAIAQNGDITYFYADPNAFRSMWFSSIPITFTLSKADRTVEFTANAVLHWDGEKAVEAMRTQVAELVTAEALCGENTSLQDVTKNLVLPKAVTDANGEKILWSLISWTCSDPDVIIVDSSAQGTADTLFDPYTGIVKRGVEDQKVTLTASFHFQRTAYDEPDIIYTKEFEVCVKGIGDAIRAQMQAQLDESYTADKLTYIGTHEKIDPENINYDLQLLLPRTSGIENPEDYSFEVTSDNDKTAHVNASRVFIFRPLPGEPAANVTLTVKMTNKKYSGIFVTKDIHLTVAPIRQSEIRAEIALMEKVKASFFDGINNGENESADKITENLHSFYEASDNGSGGLKWAYAYTDVTDTGIAAVSIDTAHPSEQWDRFHSSNPSVVTHENLLVNREKENTDVILTACLSSTRFARYAELYPDNEDFAKLYRQRVEVQITVCGTDPTPQKLTFWQIVLRYLTAAYNHVVCFVRKVADFLTHLFGIH